jgi:hypothetical protein
LALDPGNIEALVGMAMLDALTGVVLGTDDRVARLAAAEATLHQSASPSISWVAARKPRAMSRRLSASVLAIQEHVWMIFAGFAKMELGADEEAVARFRRSVEINRNHPRSHFWLAAALTHLGRLDEARSALRARTRSDVHHRPLRRRAQRQSYLPSDMEAHP